MSPVARRLVQWHSSQTIAGRLFERDSMSNIHPGIASKITSGLIQHPGHPLERIKRKIYAYFGNFHCRDMTDPVITVRQNFDELGFPADHVGRTLNDSYYVNNRYMLRTHMTAHERELLREGHTSFLLAGSVFRRDEIDATHYPVFHQLEGVHVFNERVRVLGKAPTAGDPLLRGLLVDKQPEHSDEQVLASLTHLQATLNGLLGHLFGEQVPIRWQPCYFPFTQPSLEVEILHRGRWVEVLGSGLLQDSLLRASGVDGRVAWAFGLGLERLAMILYDIPDIRLFWSQDPRFLSQFDSSREDPIVFQPFSKYPHIARDMSFWAPAGFSTNCFFDMIRAVAGDLVESVELLDTFQKAGRTSMCFRTVYRAMDRSLTDDEVNHMQFAIRARAEADLRLELR